MTTKRPAVNEIYEYFQLIQKERAHREGRDPREEGDALASALALKIRELTWNKPEGEDERIITSYLIQMGYGAEDAARHAQNLVEGRRPPPLPAPPAQAIVVKSDPLVRPALGMLAVLAIIAIFLPQFYSHGERKRAEETAALQRTTAELREAIVGVNGTVGKLARDADPRIAIDGTPATLGDAVRYHILYPQAVAQQPVKARLWQPPCDERTALASRRKRGQRAEQKRPESHSVAAPPTIAPTTALQGR